MATAHVSFQMEEPVPEHNSELYADRYKLDQYGQKKNCNIYYRPIYYLKLESKWVCTGS